MLAADLVVDQGAAAATLPALPKLPVELLNEFGRPPDQGRQRHVAERGTDVDADQALVALAGVLVDVVLRQPPIQQVAEGRVRASRPVGIRLGQQLGT